MIINNYCKNIILYNKKRNNYFKQIISYNKKIKTYKYYNKSKLIKIFWFVNLNNNKINNKLTKIRNIFYTKNKYQNWN